MKKHFCRLLAGILAVGTAVSITACNTTQAPSGEGSSPASTQSAASQADGGNTQDVVTLEMLAKNAGESFNQYAENHVQDKMAEEIGVRLHLVNADNDKFNVMLAGGDLPDMVRTSPNTFEQLIVGKNVVPMDDYLDEYGKDITANVADTVTFSKKYWSNGQEKLYFLPVQVGPDSAGIEHQIGPVVRWDYYKELGCPEMNSIDDYLSVLKKMQDAHPTTENGEKVYAVSMFADWGNWYLVLPISAFYGYNSISGSTLGHYHVDTNQFALSLDEDNIYWKSIDFYHKANQMGILDPDTFTQKYEDLQAKMTAGRVLTAPATWAAGSYNSDHKDSAQGYLSIPAKWSNQWFGTNYKAGWTDKSIGISSNCKNPEKAVAFLNYCFSYDGARTLYSGVKGVDWEEVNGSPTLKQETLDLRNAGGEAWQKSGIGFDVNYVGMSSNAINPADGKPVDLFRDPALFPTMLSPLQKDFCDYYKVSYPSEIFDKYRKDYNTFDQSNVNSFIVALMPTVPDDIKRVEAKLDEASLKAAAKMILASSDGEYASLKEATVKEFQSLGIDTVRQWYQTEWDKASAAAQSLK